MSIRSYVFIASGLVASLSYSQSLSPNEAVQLAFQNRQAIKAASLRVESTKAARQSAASSWAPTLWIGKGSAKVPGADDNDFSLVQGIDLFGKVRSSVYRSDAEVAVAMSELKLVQLEVQRDVLSRYAQIVASRKRLSIAEESLGISTNLRQAIQKRFEVGQVPEVQVLRASIERDRIENLVHARKAEYTSAKARLSAAVGAEIATEPDKFFMDDRMQSALNTDHPQLTLIRNQVLAGAREVERLERSNLPDTQLELRRSPWNQRQDFGLRVQIHFPLFDYGRSRNEVKSVSLRRESLEASLMEAERQLTTELKVVEAEIVFADESVTRHNRLVSDAKQLVEIAEKGLVAGALTLVETLEAAAALRTAEEALVEAEYKRSQAYGTRLFVTGRLLEVKS
ncbi:MAG TPA: TolC family protein [Fimbriimonadaceae bacterium]|nr:TolC family protein [Fimbriimonadaceae bacterium]